MKVDQIMRDSVALAEMPAKLYILGKYDATYRIIVHRRRSNTRSNALCVL